jgi:hypothetical protein
MLAAGLQSVDTDNSLGSFHLPELGCVTTTSLFCFCGSEAPNCGGRHRKMETVKITRMRTLYKKLREGWQTKGRQCKGTGTETGMMGPGGGRRPWSSTKGQATSQSRSANGWTLTQGGVARSVKPKRAESGQGKTIEKTKL